MSLTQCGSPTEENQSFIATKIINDPIRGEALQVALIEI
jgi:hypothetical protein